jgi:hypothetical protein
MKPKLCLDGFVISITGTCFIIFSSSLMVVEYFVVYQNK